MATQFRSVNFSLYTGNQSAAELSEDMAHFEGFLKAYATYGINSISLTWFNPIDRSTGSFDTEYSDDVFQWFESIPDAATITAYTAKAKELGFNVTWKPSFLTNDSQTNNVAPWAVDPTFNPTTFLSELNDYWDWLAPIAERADVDTLILGTEHAEYAANFDSEWRTIISTVRSEFSGHLTYSALANLNRPESSADDITFWDALDSIGLSMYLPLAEIGDTTPTFDEAVGVLKNNWVRTWMTDPRVDVPAALETLSTTYDKPIFFTEFGTSSVGGALEEPTRWANNDPTNYYEQTVFYAVYLNELSKFDWFEGVNLFTNDHTGKSSPFTDNWEFWKNLHDNTFSFLEKPAGDLLRSFWLFDDYRGVDGSVHIAEGTGDLITSSESDDILIGAEGNDILAGLEGDDRMFGGLSRDTLMGGEGADFLSGGEDNDRIFGEDLNAGYVVELSSQVYRLYLATLGRAPDTPGHRNWMKRIASEEISLEGAAAGFAGSQEFQSVYGNLSDVDFIELLYQNVLGRGSDSGGLATWLARMDAGTSRAGVVVGFSESQEFVNNSNSGAIEFATAATPMNWSDEVFRIYQATLGRAPDQTGFLNWVTRLSNGDALENVISGFVASQEFQSTYGALSNSDFVELLYQNVLGRPSDPVGLAGWVADLDSGAARSAVVRGFSQSLEFINNSKQPLEAWMRQLGVDDTLLGQQGYNEIAGGLFADEFQFNANDAGTHVVLDLEPWDKISFAEFGYETVEDIRAHFTQVNAAVVFSDQGSQITLLNTQLSQISDEMLGIV